MFSNAYFGVYWADAYFAPGAAETPAPTPSPSVPASGTVGGGGAGGGQGAGRRGAVQPAGRRASVQVTDDDDALLIAVALWLEANP